MTPIERKIQRLRNDGENEFADMVEDWLTKALDADEFRQSVTDALAALRAKIEVERDNWDDDEQSTFALNGLDATIAELGLAPEGKE
jgi:hypothetical protein